MAIRAPALRIVYAAWRLPAARSPRHVASLHIGTGGGQPLVGVPHQLTVAARDQHGAIMAVEHVRWRSSDTTVARIDANGELHATRLGKLRVTASVGGWRETDAAFDVRMSRSDTLLVEEWTGQLEKGWVPFGEPAPLLVRQPTGASALLNNGDGQFESGVHSLHTYPANGGLALTFRPSTPVTMGQWQELRAGLLFGVDSTALAAWDHRSGLLVAGGRTLKSSCGLLYPGGAEGLGYPDSLMIQGASKPGAYPAPSLKRGSWYDVRVQLFPDGRCGVAIDGKPIDITAPIVDVRQPALLVLSGRSVDTRILVGRLTSVRGVPDDIDWFHPSGKRPP